MNTKGNIFKILLAIAGMLNIVALILIIMPVIHLTPLTLIISAVFGGGLMTLAMIIYIIIVTRDLIERGVL
ncbi:MAG: hypothetical protein KAJ31_03695 [Deltaproteobacteria bacterium]|nr:hypothetical protein [Deltaproteobacteria bacterium]